jgi:hypothetical protein
MNFSLYQFGCLAIHDGYVHRLCANTYEKFRGDGAKEHREREERKRVKESADKIIVVGSKNSPVVDLEIGSVVV